MSGRFIPRTHRPGSKRDMLHQLLQEKVKQASLSVISLRESCLLPPNEDVYEWLAVNLADFFNEINLLHAQVGSHARTEQSYPTMAWAENLMNDERLFPRSTFAPEGVPYPADFFVTVKEIFGRLLAVFAHLYSHLDHLVAVGAEPKLNERFKRFLYFSYEFDLQPTFDQLKPVQDLVDRLLDGDRPTKPRKPDTSATAGPDLARFLDLLISKMDDPDVSSGDPDPVAPPPGALDLNTCHQAAYALGIKQGMLLRLLWKPGDVTWVDRADFATAVTTCFEMNRLKAEGEQDMHGAILSAIEKLS